MASSPTLTSAQAPPPGIAPTAGIVHDNIYITDNVALRTIAVSTFMPETMARHDWRVDDFDLHKELYRGKTSLLYSATDRRSGIAVALKLYRKRKLSTLNKYQVEREIRIHIQLDHVNIVKLYAAFEDEKNVYMVQEFAGGGDLFEDLKRNGGSIKEKYVVRDIIVPFLNALQYLHGLGIIHRDIKPENILLSSQRVIKIADFGLSIIYTQERPVTRAGTLDYMAPEVLICPDKRRPEENKDKVLLTYTAQVDAWAVGILCYELLVGYPPFEQESRASTYEYIMYKEPKFPGWMSEDAKRFISLALCKNATQRPTIRDLGQQPLILSYAKPVEKPVEQLRPQDFLVERSPRSILGSPIVPGSPLSRPTAVSSAPATPAASTVAAAAAVLAPLASKRPPMLTTSAEGITSGTDEQGTIVSPNREGAKKELLPISRQGSACSSMTMDEDASYSITDFAVGAHGEDAGSSKAQPSGLTRVSSVSRLPGSPMIKSRLGVGSTGGAAPSGSGPASPHASALPASHLGVAGHIKLTPITGLGKASYSQNGAHWEPTSPTSASPRTDGGQSEDSAGNLYSRPQDGILSSDSTSPLIKVPGSHAVKGGGLVERPNLETLLGTSSGSGVIEDHEHAAPTGGDSKYSKLFAKMWGKKGPDSKQADALAFSIQHKLASPRSGKGGVRSLQEELLAERADSLLVTDRNGSVVGAPSMNFKKPSPAVVTGQHVHSGPPAGLEADKAHAKKALFAGGSTSAHLEDGPLRMNSDAMLARLAIGATSGARSFTSANSPAMKKLANAPIVNKIQEYVQAQGSAQSEHHK